MASTISHLLVLLNIWTFSFPFSHCPALRLHLIDKTSAFKLYLIIFKINIPLHVYFCMFLKADFYTYCCTSAHLLFLHNNLSQVIYCQLALILQVKVCKGNMLVWSSLIEDTPEIHLLLIPRNKVTRRVAAPLSRIWISILEISSACLWAVQQTLPW